MGLTIHYTLTSTAKTANQAKALVEQMRQLALDLPFEDVQKIRYCGPNVCQRPLEKLRGSKLFDAIADCTAHIVLPWHRHRWVNVAPLEIYSFYTLPAPGCERARFGLARYPAKTEVEYHPMADAKFEPWRGTQGGLRLGEVGAVAQETWP